MAGTLIGRYELVRMLGRGGMGEVHEAVLHGPSGFRKRVALKRLRSGRELGEAQRAALIAEARLGALLSHPNVVATWELGETDEGWYVAMELVRGASVWDLRRSGPIGALAGIDVGTQAAAGLAHIHELRVDGQAASLVHRDIKPANLLVDRSGLVKIADLGIAALAGHRDEGVVIGTPGFVAPEQLDGVCLPRSDLFALGVVLAWLATGERPFGSGPQALVALRRCERHLKRGRVIEQVEAALPGLGEVVRRCLREDPDQRWTSARELGAALRELRATASGPWLADLVAERFPDEVDGPSTPVGATPHAPTRFTAPPTPPTNLPELGLRVVGRAAELDAIGRALRDNRLVVVRGPAGVGKSRLAVEVARKQRTAHPGGTWRIDLEEVRSVAGLCAEVGRVLGVPLARGEPVDRLGHALAGREGTLLLLDDADRAGGPLVEVVPRWLGVAPDLRIVVASRRKLGIGEHEVVLQPLNDADALQLLRERAGNALASAEEAVLQELVAGLDGLPLAIELAAARAAFLSPEALVARMSDRFRLLASSGRGRHATLRAALDSSWELLEPPERSALAQLSVFAGGFRLEAVEAVLDLGPEAPWALDVLQVLSEHSLVRFDPEARRFRMLPTVREYARGRLERPEEIERRHGEYFARLSELADPGRDGPDAADPLRVLAREQENLVVAVHRAVARGDVAVAVQIVQAAALVLHVVGPVSAALPLLESVSALPLPDDERAELIRSVSSTALATGDLGRAEALAREAIALAQRCGAEVTAAGALVDLGNVLRLKARSGEAQRVYELALEQAERLGSLRLVARAVGDVAMVYRLAGRRGEARACYERAMALNRSLKLQRSLATNLNNYGNLLSQSGELDRARQAYREGLEIARQLGDEPMAALLYGNMALETERAGNPSQSARFMERALRSYRRLGYVPETVIHLSNLAWASVDLGRRERGRRLAEEAIALGEAHGLEAWMTVALLARGYDHLLAGRVAEARADAHRAVETEEEAGDHRAAAMARMVLVLAARARGDLSEARAQVGPMLAWGEEYDDWDLLANAHLQLAWITLEEGNAAAAETWVCRALERCRGTLAVRCHAVAARALAGLGRSEEALEHLKLGEQCIEALELRPEAPAVGVLAEARDAIGP